MTLSDWLIASVLVSFILVLLIGMGIAHYYRARPR